MSSSDALRIAAALVWLVAFYFVYSRSPHSQRERQLASTSGKVDAYTMEAQRLVEHVWQLMARYHQTEVRAEHLLWAILHSPGERLTRILQELPLDVLSARVKVETLVSGFPQHRLWPLFNKPWLSSEIRAALDQARGEATQFGAEQIAPLHLLLALAKGKLTDDSERAGLTARLLQELGVTPETLAQAITKADEAQAL